MSTYFCCLKLHKAVLTTATCKGRSMDPKYDVCFHCDKENGTASKINKKGGSNRNAYTLALESRLAKLSVKEIIKFKPKHKPLESMRNAARRFENENGLQYNMSIKDGTLSIERVA